MYTEFYQLTDQPFQLTPDHRFFFGSSVHKRAMAHLTFGLSQGEGFIIITGDVGAGKTTLMGHLLNTLDSDRYVSGTIVTTQLGGDDMLRMVASSFDIDNENADKATLLQRIEARFKSLSAEGKHCLLMVDEVQNLSFQALEELRMLSNFQVNGKALLQSFLLGQPQFRRTLASQDLDQLRQRVIASYHLGPVGKQEVRAYIEHRLKAVGWNNDPEITEDAYAEIFEHTGGVPRKLNVLCSRLLLFGFLEEEHRIDRDSVVQVAEDLFRETEQILDHVDTQQPASTPQPAAALSPPESAQPQPESTQPEPAQPEPTQPTAAQIGAVEAAPTIPSPPPQAPQPPAQISMETPPAPDEALNITSVTTDAEPVATTTEDVNMAAQRQDAPAIEGPVDTDTDINSPGPTADNGEIDALQERLTELEAQFERHERMLRWTQLMLKHHERLLRRRSQGVITRA